MEAKKLLVSSSPHMRSERTVTKEMLDVIIALIPSTDLLNTINRIAVVNMYTAGILIEITFLITRYAAPINMAIVETSPIHPPIFPINISNKAGFCPPDKTVAADTAETFPGAT